LFLVTHSGLAMVGLAVAACVVALWLNPAWMRASEERLFTWLRERQVLVSWLPENAAERATAMDLRELPSGQAAVAVWLARKYRVAPEPVAALVAEAQVLAKKYKLAPNLILGVMSIESNFHPYIQSQVGAQGLMQVMTNIHTKRYQAYGGNLTAFDPITNMRVGVAVLADAIKLKGGSLEDGLKFYLGGDAVVDDGGYVAKVRAEEARLDQVASGVNVPIL
jgi:soluble lytic murein transglycosylase-like protein